MPLMPCCTLKCKYMIINLIVLRGWTFFNNWLYHHNSIHRLAMPKIVLSSFINCPIISSLCLSQAQLRHQKLKDFKNISQTTRELSPQLPTAIFRKPNISLFFEESKMLQLQEIIQHLSKNRKKSKSSASKVWPHRVQWSCRLRQVHFLRWFNPLLTRGTMMHEGSSPNT